MAKIKTEEQKLVEKVRENLATHVVEVEIDMNPYERKVTGEVLEHCRLIRNTALGQAYKRYNQMVRTKKYRKLLQQYRVVSERLHTIKDKKEQTLLNKQKIDIKKALEQKQKEYSLEDVFRRKVKRMMG